MFYCRVCLERLMLGHKVPRNRYHPFSLFRWQGYRPHSSATALNFSVLPVFFQLSSGSGVEWFAGSIE